MPVSNSAASAASCGPRSCQSSSAACNVGAMPPARTARVRSRDTTASWPSRPDLSEASFIVRQCSWHAVEALLETAPALGIVFLKRIEIAGVPRQVLGKSRLEHKRQSVGELDRLERGYRSAFERLSVRSVWQPAIGQRHPAGQKALALGLILPIDKPHELAHNVHVIPRRPESMLGNGPPLWEDHEVDIGGSFLTGGRGQHKEDRRGWGVEKEGDDRGKRSLIVFI